MKDMRRDFLAVDDVAFNIFTVRHPDGTPMVVLAELTRRRTVRLNRTTYCHKKTYVYNINRLKDHSLVEASAPGLCPPRRPRPGSAARG